MFYKGVILCFENPLLVNKPGEHLSARVIALEELTFISNMVLHSLKCIKGANRQTKEEQYSTGSKSACPFDVKDPPLGSCPSLWSHPSVKSFNLSIY